MSVNRLFSLKPQESTAGMGWHATHESGGVPAVDVTARTDKSLRATIFALV